jgi:hypothetical protein
MIKRVMFYAFLDDILPLIELVEMDLVINYYQTGLFDTRDIPQYGRASEIQSLGISNGDWISDIGYLILLKSEHLNIREVPQKSGGVKFAVDQMMNEKSIRINFGGIYSEESRILVAGAIDTISELNVSMEIFSKFKKRISKTFKKIGDFYVGKQAEENLKDGWRLVLDQGRSKEYDLKL